MGGDGCFNQRRSFGDRDVLRHLPDFQHERLTHGLPGSQLHALAGLRLETRHFDLQPVRSIGKRRQREFTTLIGHAVARDARSLVRRRDARARYHGSGRVVDNSIEGRGRNLCLQAGRSDEDGDREQQKARSERSVTHLKSPFRVLQLLGWFGVQYSSASASDMHLKSMVMM